MSLLKSLCFALAISLLVSVVPAQGVTSQVRSLNSGDAYSINENFQNICDIDNLVGRIDVYDEYGSKYDTHSLPVTVNSGGVNYCDYDVSTIGNITLPTLIGMYDVEILLYDEFYDEVLASRSYPLTVNSGVSAVEVVFLTVSHNMPLLTVDAGDAPKIKFKYRAKNSSGSYVANWCPKSYGVQFKSTVGKNKGKWRTIGKTFSKSLKCTTGSGGWGYVTLKLQTPGSGYLRVLLSGKTSKAKKIVAQKPTDVFRLKTVYSNEASAKWIGDSARLEVWVQQKLKNGLWVTPLNLNTNPQLTKSTGGAWSSVGKCRTVSTTSGLTYFRCVPVKLRALTKLRVSFGSFTSKTVTFNARAVKLAGIYLDGGWPNYMGYYDSFNLKVGARGSNRREWRSPVKIVFQYRETRYGSWQNLDYDTSTLTKWARIRANYQGRGYYRLMVAGTNVVLEQSYF